MSVKDIKPKLSIVKDERSTILVSDVKPRLSLMFGCDKIFSISSKDKTTGKSLVILTDGKLSVGFL